jgi:hypothetical protein
MEKTIRLNNIAKSICALLLLAGCMAKVENEDVIEGVEITSHDIERDGGNVKVTLHGTCPKSSTALKMDVDSTLFDVIPSSMTTYVDGSGVPVGNCVNGVLTVEYPVPNPTQQPRIIKFKVKAKMNDGKISLYAALRDVDFALPAENLAGFEVNSGGGFETTGAITIHASAGTVASRPGSYLIPGGTGNLRAGLQGLLYNDSF